MKAPYKGLPWLPQNRRVGEAAVPRVQFFTGKGGVGKSSLVAATALRAAQLGGRPLIVELSERRAMAGLWGRAVGPRPTQVADVGEGVHALAIDREVALGDFMAARLGMRRLSRLPVLRRFLRAAPSVDELLTLDLLTRLSAECVDGHWRWDPFLIDLDATGHALMFLALPKVFEDLAPSGPLRNVLDAFTTTLASDASVLHLVSLPDALPVQETEELFGALQAQATVRLGCLYINRMPEPKVSEDDQAGLDKLASRMPLEVTLARAELARAEEARAARVRLTQMGLRVIPVPELPVGGFPGSAHSADEGEERRVATRAPLVRQLADALAMLEPPENRAAVDSSDGEGTHR